MRDRNFDARDRIRAKRMQQGGSTFPKRDNTISDLRVVLIKKRKQKEAHSGKINRIQSQVKSSQKPKQRFTSRKLTTPQMNFSRFKYTIPDKQQPQHYMPIQPESQQLDKLLEESNQLLQQHQARLAKQAPSVHSIRTPSSFQEFDRGHILSQISMPSLPVTSQKDDVVWVPVQLNRNAGIGRKLNDYM